MTSTAENTGSLDLGVVGNCQVSALIERRGRISWFCAPRFDSDPVFCSLLSGESNPTLGFFDIELLDEADSEQFYHHNSAVLETVLKDRRGGSLRILDFAPRFTQFGRQFRPVMIIRRIEPGEGSPRLRIRLRPATDYGRKGCGRTFGSNHVRYIGTEFVLRLTTDMSITHVLEETPFVLEKPVTLMLGPDETVSDSIDKVGLRFLDETNRYWQSWVQGLSIPFEWQDAVIRAAITLKMCTYEDTGAVVAAMTTSIPESSDSGRNWDYRYCWLRDTYYVVQALNRLGALRTMENYLGYIVDIVASAESDSLQPVYGITGRSALQERIVDQLPGYRSMGPVRVGNEAYVQQQHDVYGAVVMAATQMFFDRRLSRPGGRDLFEQLEHLGETAVRLHDQPDAGLWEYRQDRRVHTFSGAMCWAACDRLARVAEQLSLKSKREYWQEHAEKIRIHVEREGFDTTRNTFVDSSERGEVDASLLQLHELGFLSARDTRFLGTISAIEQRLRRNRHLLRYNAADDIGIPQNAFTICTFWYIDALAAAGRMEEARELFEYLLTCRNPLGMLSEGLDPNTEELWGNFPQTYSMVGIVNSATRLSKPWRDAF